MTDNTSDSPRKMSLWKQLVIPSLVGGTGLGLIVVCAIGAFYSYQSRPKKTPWNLNAILSVEPGAAAVDLSVGLLPDTTPAVTAQPVAAFTARSASVKPEAPGNTASASSQSQSLDPGLTGMVTAGLRNTTPEDITLPRSVLVMESEEGTHVLHISKFKLDHDYFVPALHAVSVTLLADNPCTPENTPEMCVESYFQGEDEIVLFDKFARFEIHIPIKSIRLLRIQPKRPLETPAATPAKAPAAAGVAPFRNRTLAKRIPEPSGQESQSSSEATGERRDATPPSP